MRNVLFSTLVVVPGFLFSGCAFDVDGEAVLETDAGDIGAVLPAASLSTIELPECSLVANLEVVPLDIWGRDLDPSSIRVEPSFDAYSGPNTGAGAVQIRLGTEPARFTVDVGARDFHSSAVQIDYDGGGVASAFTVSVPTNGARVAAGWQAQDLDGASCPTFSVYIGVDHEWFAASGRGPSFNRAEIMMDGEAVWSAVADDLSRVQERVSWSTWWWESDFEMVRSGDHRNSNQWERRRNTVMEQLESLQQVEKRVLVNRFWGENSDLTKYVNTDEELRDKATSPHDNFEMILQGHELEVDLYDEWEGEVPDFNFAERVISNERYVDRDLYGLNERDLDLAFDVASWHQKAMVFDGEVAYIVGVNTKGTDWDSMEHRVFDERRMEIDADEDDRADVYYREDLPDYQPRKDYGARIEGPAVRDVEEMLHARWELAIDDDDLYASYASSYDLDEAPAEVPASAGGVELQVVGTMPSPLAEQSVMETHLKAISNATNYIFIEDQYFRSTIMNEAIVEQMHTEPELVLIVVTMPVANADGGAKYTYESDYTFRTLFPDRYLLLQLKAVDLVTEEGVFWDDVDFYVESISTHSKLRLIDDHYVSVGSTNMNNRGYLYEGEMNVSVLDVDLATDLRRRVFANLVGPYWAQWLTDDPKNNLAVLEMAAENNQEILDWWEDYADDLSISEAEYYWTTSQPEGFVYPLQVDDDYWFDVGPDFF